MRHDTYDTCPVCGGPKTAHSARCARCADYSDGVRRAQQVRAAHRDATFFDRADRSGGPSACWPWLGRRQRYGVIIRGGRQVGAHRVALELALGRPLTPGMFACHTCDNPPCVNPAHLYEGTARDNTADMFARGRDRWAQYGLSLPVKP